MRGEGEQGESRRDGDRAGTTHAHASVRMFAAVRPPATVAAAITELLQRGRREVADGRWIRGEQAHLTLAFWSAVPGRLVPKLTTALRASAAEFAPFDLTLGDVGAFPDISRPKIVWLGAQATADQFTWLARSTQAAGRSVGVAAARQGASAHLTLARPRTADGAAVALRLAAAFEQLPQAQRTWRVTSFELVESKLDHRGAEHHPIATFALAG